MTETETETETETGTDPSGDRRDPADRSARRSSPVLTKLWYVTGPVLAALVVLLVVVAVRPVPYFTISPGSARAVEPLVTISARPGGPKPHIDTVDKGLFFVTVSVRKPAGIEAVASLLDHTVDIVPEDLVTGGQSRADNNKFNLALMTSSKDKAAKVALDRAGYPVTVTATGAVVTDIGPDYPVAKVLKPGDTVVAADGRKIRSNKDLVAVIAGHEPGDTVRLTVEGLGDGARRTVRAKLVARPDDHTKALLGVSLESRPHYDFPLDVAIDSGQVGGPSAGLAFTLAILDRITPGDLTGGKPVAVTGTIELDGSVGPVGGVAQKTEAAIRAGAKVFLVPPDEYHDARTAARGRLEIRQVSTLEEALTALQRFGGDPVPAPAPATSDSDTGG